jgi:XTP/dITP diphosphohydrolase
MIHKIILASKNEGKIKEFYHLLTDEPPIEVATLGHGGELESQPRNWEIVSLRDFPEMPDVEETGTTFVENALLKARQIAQYSHLPALSDDSGLSISALGGRPGVYSARYAGGHGDSEANMAKVLSELAENSDKSRSAYFTCVVALVIPNEVIQNFPPITDPEILSYMQPNGNLEVTCEGKLHGSIGFEKKGEFGFGYDPIFIPEGDSRTLAEYSPDQKKMISHRSIAMRAMERQIKRIFP